MALAKEPAHGEPPESRQIGTSVSPRLVVARPGPRSPLNGRIQGAGQEQFPQDENPERHQERRSSERTMFRTRVEPERFCESDGGDDEYRDQ